MSKQVEYIIFTGTQYIDTGFIPDGNTSVEITFSLNEDVNNNRAIFGSRANASSTDSTSFTLWTIDTNKIRFDHYGKTNTISGYNPREKHTCKMTPTEEIIDGTVVKTHAQSTNKSPLNLTIGKAYTNKDDQYYGKFKFYGCKIYDNGTLVRDYVPFRDDAKEFCLKDLVNDTLNYAVSNKTLFGSFDSSDIFTGNILDFDYTGTAQTITLPKGTYKLECWGAQGGTYNNNKGGLGGYSVGTLTLTEKTPIYVYVGGQPTRGTNAGFNGGGAGIINGKGGGGATDIRLKQDSLYARVIVAGGGGGAGVGSASANPCGCGGGEYGGDGYYNNTTGSYLIGSSRSGGSASQTAGGKTWSTGAQAAFGVGGDASGYSCGGGGGGWYGGGGAYDNDSDSDGRWGGGGSGYVYTFSTASNYPSGCLLNSSYYLTDAQTIAGNSSFKSPTGSSIIGESSNGYCRITIVECSSVALYIKVNNSLKQTTGLYFKLNNKMYDIGNARTVNSDVMNFDHTGSVQTATLNPGTYKLECWGAQGGTYHSYYGGAGGYSVGIINLTETIQVYIYVGGQPETQTSDGSSTGGFNGGGKGKIRAVTSSYGQGGGGASDIRIGQDSLYARVIVAGGGGGSSHDNSLQTKCGGGITGGSSQSGYGASQTAAGKNGSFGEGGYATAYGLGGGGGGWYGGGACSSSSFISDTKYRAYNGGGSGYVYTSSTTSNYPSGCLLNSSYYLTDAKTIAGDQTFLSPSGTNETGHTGSGYVRITHLNIQQYGLYIKQNGTWTHIDL